MRILKIAIIICFGFLCKNTKGQDEYFVKEKSKIDSISNNFRENLPKKYYTFLPSINYNLQNNSFNIGFSLNSLTSFYQNKRRNKIELSKLENSLNQKLEQNLKKINLDLTFLENEIELTRNKIEIFEIEINLYKIILGKYKNSEITTENFLKEKKNFLSKKLNINTQIQKLNLSAQQLEENFLIKKSNKIKSLENEFENILKSLLQ